MRKLIFLSILILSPMPTFGADIYSWHWTASGTTAWYRGVAGIPIQIKNLSTTYPTSSVTLRLWAGNGGVTGNIKLVVYNSDHSWFADSNPVDASTITSYSGSSWYSYPMNTSVGGYVTFTFSSLINIPNQGYIQLDTSGLSNMYEVYMGTSFGSSWDSTHNVVCYQGNWTCVDDSESLDVAVGSFDVLSPVEGYINTEGLSGGSCNSGAWCFNQHNTLAHVVGGGVGNADDTYAWDANLNYPSFDTDNGLPVYAVATGTVTSTYAGSTNCGGTYGQVLVEHTRNGLTWWSAYLHMTNIQVQPNETITTTGKIIGYVSNTGVPDHNYHLHFTVYTGINSNGNLVSFPATFVER